jgi:replicative DNA helicase
MVLPELSILKSFLVHDNWVKNKDRLSPRDFPRQLQPLLSILNNFHQNHAVDLSIQDFSNLVAAATFKDQEFYNGIVETLASLDVSEQTTQVLINAFQKKRLLAEISLTAYDITEGKGNEEAFQKLISLYSEDKTEDTQEEEALFLENDLESVLNRVVEAPGLKWRLGALNKMLGSLRKGNFGLVFARPETGKTTLLASEVSFMAEQLTEESGPIIWFNNEQVGEEVLLRLYQASTGQPLANLLANKQAAQRAYIARTKGKIKLVDRATLTKDFIERVCKQFKPSLVVVDQMDAVRGFQADRNDLQLGECYRWGRELAKQYCPIIAICQADASGEGQKWLTMANVADAKTAKQAHCDWIVGIGKTHDPGYEMLRYLHASKNKLLGDPDITDPALRHGRLEVLIEPAIGRYKDIH